MLRELDTARGFEAPISLIALNPGHGQKFYRTNRQGQYWSHVPRLKMHEFDAGGSARNAFLVISGACMYRSFCTLIGHFIRQPKLKFIPKISCLGSLKHLHGSTTQDTLAIFLSVYSVTVMGSGIGNDSFIMSYY